jgi:hypothetical protein
MFSHPNFRHYTFSEVPADRDLYLIDVKDMPEFEREWLELYAGKEYDPKYLVSYAAVRARFDDALELSWYPNVSTRFHEVRVTLPKSAFVHCIGQYRHDGNPSIFVQSEWLKDLYLRANSIFALIDAIGVEAALRSGAVSRARLLALRDRIDKIAAEWPTVSFVSFGDSLLLKKHWWPASVELQQSYDYEPETIVDICAAVDRAYQETLGLRTYAVLVQGANEYYQDPLLHISSSRNHVSLNSLGLPFVQLLAIDAAARKAIRAGEHDPFDLYIDSDCLHSLDLELGFKREDLATGKYTTKMASGTGQYYAVPLPTIQSSRRKTEPHKTGL